MSKKIKLLQVIPSLNNGGAEMLAIRTSEHLDAAIFQPMICSLSDEGPLRSLVQEKNIPLFTLDKKAGKDFGLAGRLRRLIKDERPDIIHSHNLGPLLYAALACLFMPGRPIRVHSEHINMETELTSSSRHRIMQRVLFRSLDGCIAIAEHLARHLNQKFIFKHPIEVIPNGIDIHVRDRKTYFGNLKNELGISSDTYLVGNISALRPQKDHLTLIRAAELLKADCPDIRFAIAGDGESMELLRHEISRMGLDNVVMLLGYRADVHNLLHGFDLFVLPSLYEGLPLCLLEAMAAQLPVITTDVQGNNELVRHEIDGLLFPARDARALALAIKRLHDDPGHAAALARHGRETVEKEYAFERMIGKYEAYYHKMYTRRR
jgi:glycosyltransferase involved in cell wall biosynthesis